VARFDCITFLTDYGLAAGFVGTCHGVAARIAPHARVIDVSHDVPPGDVRTAAVLLSQSIDYLPVGVHVVVVDPGVGTERRGVAVSGRHGFFVGPDNGLLTWAFPPAAVTGAWELRNEELFLRPVSRTFHGRDLFSPAAAHLARGVELGELGPPVAVDALVRLDLPEPELGAHRIRATVLYIDAFGNIQLNLTREHLDEANVEPGARVELELDGRRYYAVTARTFSDARPGDLILYEDSYRNIAVAMNRGDAGEMLAARAGQQLRINLDAP
jgi:S-adenosylmethionine hydrolase